MVLQAGQWQKGIGLIVVCKHLLFVIVEQPTVADAVAAVWTDTGRRPAHHPLFTGSGSNPPSIAVRRSLLRAGCATPTVRLGNGNAGTRLRKAHCAQGQAAQRKTRNGDWRKTQCAHSATPGESQGEGVGEERSAADGYVAGRRAGASCVAMASVRSVVANGPERDGPAVKPLFCQQLRRNRGEAAGDSQSLQPQGEGNAKRPSAPRVMPVGKGMPGTPCRFRLPPPSISL